MNLKHPQNKLVFYRRRMRLSQKQVSTLLGQFDKSMVSHYEHGHFLPPLPVALALEIVLRTPVAFLFPEMYEALRNDIRKIEELKVRPTKH